MYAKRFFFIDYRTFAKYLNDVGYKTGKIYSFNNHNITDVINASDY